MVDHIGSPANGNPPLVPAMGQLLLDAPPYPAVVVGLLGIPAGGQVLLGTPPAPAAVLVLESPALGKLLQCAPPNAVAVGLRGFGLFYVEHRGFLLY